MMLPDLQFAQSILLSILQVVKNASPSSVGSKRPGGPSGSSAASTLAGSSSDAEAMLQFQHSMKRLKEARNGAAGQQSMVNYAISDQLAKAAIDLLTEVIYENPGTIPLSIVENPKMREFLKMLVLPPVSRKWVAGPQLDEKFEEAKAECDKKLAGASQIQIALNGWKKKNVGHGEKLVNCMANLPDGGSVFWKVHQTQGALLTPPM
jgi:hypothetical protein